MWFVNENFFESVTRLSRSMNTETLFLLCVHCGFVCLFTTTTTKKSLEKGQTKQKSKKREKKRYFRQKLNGIGFPLYQPSTIRQLDHSKPDSFLMAFSLLLAACFWAFDSSSNRAKQIEEKRESQKRIIICRYGTWHSSSFCLLHSTLFRRSFILK